MDSVADGGGAAEYGDRIADVYDEWHGERDDVGPVVEFLASWAAGDWPVLELGVGTGRTALALAGGGRRRARRGCAAAGRARAAGGRHRRVGTDGGPASGQAGRGRPGRDGRGLH